MSLYCLCVLLLLPVYHLSYESLRSSRLNRQMLKFVAKPGQCILGMEESIIRHASGIRFCNCKTL